MNFLLIADLVVSLLVFLCVALTLLEIAGGAYFMGLTIEISTSIILILAVGLALDYSAHIGVTYIITKKGNRKERTQETLNTMGTAVFNGGFSTFLAFSLVAFSNSYVFLTFFKVNKKFLSKLTFILKFFIGHEFYKFLFQMFSCVVVFGLFHGLFVLPVLLSLVGPSLPQQEDTEAVKSSKL